MTRRVPALFVAVSLTAAFAVFSTVTVTDITRHPPVVPRVIVHPAATTITPFTAPSVICTSPDGTKFRTSADEAAHAHLNCQETQ